ncbi:ferrochelatase [Saccharicrinis sp. FJH2]|uniref:ferrochelatase n=1 Tax=Saccharicrinis sp. FJH65 TaxID=3344659 RepID=UPI0035F4473F
MKHKKTALLIVNLGTPDNPDRASVRRYLTEFLNDRRVIDIPWLLQKMLVNLIIIPFRVKNSTRLYQRLWTDEGSPLLINLMKLAVKVQKLKGEEVQVFAAMRYDKPALTKVLNEIHDKDFNEIIVFPLFPQYASSTTGSIFDLVFTEAKKWQAMPGIRFIDQYYDHPAFVEAFSKRIASYKPEKYDHVIFSYHGLPERQINKIHPQYQCAECDCVNNFPEQGTYCYKATCYQTTRLLAKAAGLKSDRYSVGFQSRLSKNWLNPFTDELIKQKAKEGAKNILITAPSFVADCLETFVELEVEYQHLFKEHGGEKLTLVHSLNDTDDWAKAIVEIVE